MIRPAIEGILLVDISRHVDKYGTLSRDGSFTAWGAIAAAPAGVTVRLRIGGLRSLAGSDLAYQLGDARIQDAARIEVEGSDAGGITAVIEALRYVRDHASAV